MCVPRLIFDERGAQIVEFAVVLPLLAVLIVGILDFGQAFAIRQKLTFAARDAARFGSSEPTNDLTLGTPPSVIAIRDLVDADLLAANVNDCNLGTIQAGSSPVAWTATGACANSGTFTLTIDRGEVIPPPPGGMSLPGANGPTYMIATHVNMSYPYQWRFAGVIQMLVPSASYGGILQIQTDAVAPNQD
jgi:Flp pilus assembly pilin Flp